MAYERTNARTKRRLGRLIFDTSGNTLAIMAAAIFPVMGIVGSAFDISRMYMVKSRLQQACDAGALAARRAMTKTTLDGDAETQAHNFFNFNYPTDSFGTTGIVFTPQATSEGQVTAVAAANVPMTLMRMFGAPTKTIQVSCDAKLEVPNADVMFVLDVTGSMDGTMPGDSRSKLAALQSAVVGFYDILNNAVTSNARLRFGIVPYSAGVNVGGLLPAEYLADSWTYQSRRRIPNGTYTTSISPDGWPALPIPSGSWTTYSTTSNVRENNCSAPSPNPSTSESNNSTNWGTPNEDADGVRVSNGTETRTVTVTEYRDNWTQTGTDSRGRKIGTCDLQRRSATATQQRSTTKTETPNYTWSYEPVTLDTSRFKLGETVQTRTGNSFTMRSSTWNGCIEERQWVTQATFSSPVESTAPDAFDLNIDFVPNSEETRWKPSWPDIIYTRSGTPQVTNSNNSRPSTICPKAAINLDVMTHAQISNYVNASDFVATGNTYHDLGMIWGARLISPTGIFGSRNATAPNGRPINRHIVFMTDGKMEPNSSLYNTYGYEALDQRVSGGDLNSSRLADRHTSRFLAVCAAARARNITVWTVGFGTASADNAKLAQCADPGKALTAKSDEDLQITFRQIATKIAELRLSR